jgi:hypothetical protein
MSYVFPAAVRAELAIAVAVQLQTYLETGDTDFDLVGLNEAPLFLLRAGSGEAGDESEYSGAQIIYPDDEQPGAPFVRVLEVTPTASPEDWGDDQESSSWRVVLDCNANEFQGTVTEGHAPGGADSLLSDAVWNLLSHFEAMQEAGFYNANATPGNLSGEGIATHLPITVTFEIYVSKI